MVFIETLDDGADVIIFENKQVCDKYDQLSQVDTSWEVVVGKADGYDGDDEAEST